MGYSLIFSFFCLIFSVLSQEGVAVGKQGGVVSIRTSGCRMFLILLLLILSIIILYISTFPDYRFIEYIGWVLIGCFSALFLEYIFEHLMRCKV